MKYRKFNGQFKSKVMAKASVCLDRIALGSIVIGCLLAGWQGRGQFKPTYAETIKEIPVYVTATTTMPAMLLKICKAESGGKQFKADGHVLRGKITPSDIGFCQINETYWNDIARDMGIDIYTEQGNKEMAIYIFNNFGEQPWSASKSNWSK